jgi:hypothetical protein
VRDRKITREPGGPPEPAELPRDLGWHLTDHRTRGVPATRHNGPVDADRDGAAGQPPAAIHPEAPEAAADPGPDDTAAGVRREGAATPAHQMPEADHGRRHDTSAIPRQRRGTDGTLQPTPASDLFDVLRVTGQLALIALVLGLVVGVVWVWVAPDVLLRAGTDGAYLDELEGGRVFARNGWFAVLAGAAGVIVALLGWVRHRHTPVPLVIGLAISGLLGSIVAWRLGVAVGPESLAVQQETLGGDQPLQAPLRIDAPGVLLAWSVLSIATVFVLALFQRHPRRQPSHRRH